jgi:hypothetical protein
MKHLLTFTFIFHAFLSLAQTNNFPLYSNGTYSGGSGDYTNITSAQLKLQANSGWIRVPHLSSNSLISAVYNYETGKNAFWGEPSDAGQYLFRGRDFTLEEGKMGIGTNAPGVKLDINGTGGSATDFRVNGRIQIGDGSAYGGIWLSNAINMLVGQNGTNVGFWTGGVGWNAFQITQAGNVGIGTTTPDAKLSVSGQVHAQEVKVSITVPGPDYVFDKDYQLTSLDEIKTYIDQNKHLPEVPSAKEMEKNGVQLGEMNMILLKKIEELTLHLIEQNKRIDDQQKEIKELKTLISK